MRSFTWHQGDGRAVCGEQARHLTGICRRVFSASGPIVECNTDVFFDGYGLPDAARRSGQAERIPRKGFSCVGSREFPKKYQLMLPGGQLPPLVGGNEGQRPRPHSEIAALSDLFGIPSNQPLDTWVSQIRRQVAGGRYDVFLYQSQQEACGGVVGVRHILLRERMSCSRFLTNLVEQVNSVGDCRLNIYVFTPNNRVTTYGSDGLSRREVAHFRGVNVDNSGDEGPEEDISDQGIAYDELKRYILRQLSKKEEKNLCSMLMNILEREYPNYYEYLDLPGFGEFGVDSPGLNDEVFAVDDGRCDKSGGSRLRHRRWRRLLRRLSN